jgi:hypothetical protein
MDAEHALYKDIMIDKADTELLKLYAQQLMVRPFCCDLRGVFVRIDPLCCVDRKPLRAASAAAAVE